MYLLQRPPSLLKGRYIYIYIYTYIYIYIYIYINRKKTNKLQVHPYRPVSPSSGDLMRIIFTIAYLQYNLIYAVRNLTVWLLRRRALFLWRLEDTSSLYFCLVLINRVGRWLGIFLWGRDYILYLSCCTASVMKECARK